LVDRKSFNRAVTLLLKMKTATKPQRKRNSSTPVEKMKLLPETKELKTLTVKFTARKTYDTEYPVTVRLDLRGLGIFINEGDEDPQVEYIFNDGVAIKS